MKYRYLVFSLITIFVSLISYFLSENLIFSLVIFFVFVLYFIFAEFRYIKKTSNLITKNNDMHKFIHSFLLSYISDVDLNKAIDINRMNLSNELSEQIALSNELDYIERLNRLNSYFCSSFYSSFIKEIVLLKSAKENKIDLLNFLSEENKEKELIIKTYKSGCQKAIIEFAILWIFAFALSLMMRLIITNYFSKIKNTPFYIIAIAIFIIFFLFSLHLLLIKKYSKELYDKKI